MKRSAVFLCLVWMVACGRTPEVNLEQLPSPSDKEMTGRGEKLVAVMGAEEGGCPWSADADSQGRVVTIANTGSQAELRAFSLDEGKVLSKSLGRPFTVVRHLMGADELQAAHWWEDPKTGAYGWQSAYLSMSGEVLREEERGRDPFDRLGVRSDGAVLVMPHGGHFLELQKPAESKPSMFFNARDLGYTMWSARFVDDKQVMTVGISVHPIETDAGTVGSEGRWVALVMANTDGRIVWAKDLSVTLPDSAEIALSLEVTDDAAFIVGGNTWNNNAARIHVPSFFTSFDFAGNRLAWREFPNADAPSLVASEGRARLVVPFKSPSLDWYQRSMEHSVVDKRGEILHAKVIRGEGPNGIIVKRFLKANGVPVLVGCFYSQTQLAEHVLTGNGDSGFVFQLDPRIEK